MKSFKSNQNVIKKKIFNLFAKTFEKNFIEDIIQLIGQKSWAYSGFFFWDKCDESMIEWMGKSTQIKPGKNKISHFMIHHLPKLLVEECGHSIRTKGF